jgi:hypothetical protein
MNDANCVRSGIRSEGSRWGQFGPVEAMLCWYSINIMTWSLAFILFLWSGVGGTNAGVWF